MSAPKSVDEILSRAGRDAETGCWPWLKQINNKGYGLVCRGGSKRAAHVVIYEILVGPVPDGLQLDHLCRNTACCNPDHLDPVTPSENQRRAAVLMTGCRKLNHDWSVPENVYVHPRTGGRRCRVCQRARDVGRKR